MQSTKSPRARSAILALAVAALLAPAAAGAEPAATDEYSLGEVGTGAVAGRTDTLKLPEDSRPAAPGPGVVGEQDASKTPLAAIGSVAPAGVWALAAALALGAAALLLRMPRRKAR